MIEKKVSQGIISTYFSKLERNLDLDVAIVGGITPEKNIHRPQALLPHIIWQRPDLKLPSSTASCLPAAVCGAAQ